MENILKLKFPLPLPGKIQRMILSLITHTFIVLFAYTAVSKIITFHSFQLILHKSVLIGEFSVWVAYFVPSIEIIITLLLIIPKTNKIALISSLLLMVLFNAYLIYMIYFGTTRTCNCGGVLSSLNWEQHLMLNFFLMALAGIGLILNINNKNHLS